MQNEVTVPHRVIMNCTTSDNELHRTSPHPYLFIYFILNIYIYIYEVSG